jgi:hypothetical protein
MNKLDPRLGSEKWRNGVQSRFELNAHRCRQEAQRLTDPEARAFSLNLAQLWDQLAEAAKFRQELGKR